VHEARGALVCFGGGAAGSIARGEVMWRGGRRRNRDSRLPAATMMAMIIHFICRGNSFRSIIAEAYLNSLGLLEENGIREFAKAGHGDQLTQSCLDGADVVICLNKRVHDECQQLVTLPADTRIWAVADIGEAGRVADTESGKDRYREEAYQEIVEAIDQLISEIS